MMDLTCSKCGSNLQTRPKPEYVDKYTFNKSQLVGPCPTCCPVEGAGEVLLREALVDDLVEMSDHPDDYDGECWGEREPEEEGDR